MILIKRSLATIQMPFYMKLIEYFEELVLDNILCFLPEEANACQSAVK